MSENFTAPEHIVSKDNPRIRLFCALSKSKKQRHSEGLFVLEGIRLFRDALREKADIRFALFTESCYSCFGENELCGIKCFLIPDALAGRISQTETPQGVFAVCGFPNALPCAERCKKLLVLCNLQDNGNVGMIMRTADAFGVDGVVLNNCCDIFSPKTIRATMGSVFRVPFEICDDIAGLARRLKQVGFTLYASVVGIPADAVGAFDFAPCSCVLIGNEGNGLSEAEIAVCDKKITIEMNGNIESLNAAMASGIILWELCEKNQAKRGSE